MKTRSPSQYRAKVYAGGKLIGSSAWYTSGTSPLITLARPIAQGEVFSTEVESR